MRHLPSALIACCVLAASAAVAQEGQQASPEARRPWSKSAWVKLCETPAAAGRDLFGSDRVVGVETCLVHHEQLNPANGAVAVAAAVRTTEARQTFTVMVPAGVQWAPAVRVVIFPADLWQRVNRRERIEPADQRRLRKLTFRYAFCRPEGCVAETSASARLIADLKSRAGLMVFVVRNGRPVGFAVSLAGFTKAYDGAPVDIVRWRAARAELLRRLRRERTPSAPLRPRKSSKQGL